MKILILIICILGIFLFGASCVKTNSAEVSQKNNSLAETKPDEKSPTKSFLSQNSNFSSVTSLLDKDLQSKSFKETSNETKASEPPRYKMRMLMDAEYYEEEVEDKIGLHKNWLGLYRKNDKYFLIPAVIEVKATRHALRDDEKSKEKTGRTVKSNVKLPNLFLLKNAKMLKPGEVKTVFYGNEENSDLIARTYRREFEFNGEKYALFIEDSGNEEGNHLTQNSRMVIAQGNRKQVIYKTESCSDCSWDLCWVGDLDKDGKLDFMFNLTPHYNSTCHTLFLSSPAKKGEIVSDVAEICQQGC